MKVILVAGTWGEKGAAGQWWWPSSPFAQFLARQGRDLVSTDEPFQWSTQIDGVIGQPLDWVAGGANLLQYCVPPLCKDRRLPQAEVNIIAHSHGGQVALYAAQMGLKIGQLVTVCTPVRNDVMKACPDARKNIDRWLHLYSDHTDYMQVLGEFFDSGALAWRRKHPWADGNAFIGHGLGHSDILRDPQYFPLWLKNFWLPKETK